MTEEMNPALDRQPKTTDPLEIRISKEIHQAVLRTDFALKFITNAKLIQSDFFEFAFDNLSSPDLIKIKYQKALDILLENARPKITSGSEYIQTLKDKKGVIFVTNHFGIGKLTKIQNSDGHLDVPLTEFEPFLLRHTPFVTVSDSLGLTLHESAIELPGKLLDIQKACEVVVVQAGGSNRTQSLIESSGSLLKLGRPAIVMYPEGGTSGKRNSGGAFDMDEFHSGAFVVASNLDIPLVPITQFFNPNHGYELDILEPTMLHGNDRDGILEAMNHTKTAMQNVLSEKVKSL